MRNIGILIGVYKSMPDVCLLNSHTVKEHTIELHATIYIREFVQLQMNVKYFIRILTTRTKKTCITK